MEKLRAFVKRKRKQARLTQQEFANRAGVSLSFLRAIEQGKTSLNTVKVNQVLAMFGHELGPVSSRSGHFAVFDSNTQQVVFTYKDNPLLFIVRILFNPTDTHDWFKRLHSVSLTVTITCWSTHKKMLKQYQQQMVLGQFIGVNHRYPIFEVESELTFKDKFNFPETRKQQHEWTVIFEIDGLIFQSHESLTVEFDNPSQQNT